MAVWGREPAVDAGIPAGSDPIYPAEERSDLVPIKTGCTGIGFIVDEALGAGLSYLRENLAHLHVKPGATVNGIAIILQQTHTNKK